MPLDERVLQLLARGLCALPRAVQVALTRGPIERDGLVLEPEVALLVRVSELIEGTRASSPAQVRAEQNRGARIGGGTLEGPATRDLVVTGGEGGLPARLYPSLEKDAPLLVFFHGGGFVFGDLDSHDGPCRLLSRHAGANVLAVAYRLAPEHPFPAAVDDARAALRWGHAHAAELGADPMRVGVAGDSAGGNLAAVAAQLAARDGGPAPAVQVLVYPAIDRRTRWPSLDLFAEGFYLTRESVDWFNGQYSGGSHASDPRLFPLASEDLSGLPPALVVTAGFDPLRDEGEAYASALAAAGNRVTLRRFGGLLHGFFSMVGVSSVCREAVVEIAGATRILFAR